MPENADRSIGRLEGKLDAMGENIERIMRAHNDTNHMVADITLRLENLAAQKQDKTACETCRDDILKQVPTKREIGIMAATVAGLASFAAYAVEVVDRAKEHLK